MKSKVEYNEKYSEIFALHDMLVEHDIPHDFLDESFAGGKYTKYHIYYPSIVEFQKAENPYCCSAVEGNVSISGENNRIEMMFYPSEVTNMDDLTVSNLSAQEAFERIQKADDKRYKSIHPSPSNK